MTEGKTIRDYLIGKSFYDGILEQTYEILDIEGNGIGQTMTRVRLDDGRETKFNFCHQLQDVETIVETSETQETQ